MKYLIIAFLLPFSILSAQSRNPSLINEEFSNNMDFFAMAKVKNKSNSDFLSGVKGSMYMNNNWNKCQIYSVEGHPNFSMPCNYNIYSDQFEIMIEDERFVLNPESVVLIKTGNQMFKPSTSSLEKNYYELLADSKSIKLIKSYDSDIKMVKTSTLGLNEQKLVLKNTNFFILESGEIVKIPSSKSKIIDLLNLTEEQRKKYKKLNVKKTENLIEIINLLD